MAIKVYISGISASQEVRKHQQRVLFILESLKIEHEVVDITEPDREEDKAFMRETCSKHDRANALPPQIFNGSDYLGDYDDFEVATESDNLRAFLQLPPSKNGVQNGAAEKKMQPDNISAEEGDIQGEKIEENEKMVNGFNAEVGDVVMKGGESEPEEVNGHKEVKADVDNKEAKTEENTNSEQQQEGPEVEAVGEHKSTMESEEEVRSEKIQEAAVESDDPKNEPKMEVKEEVGEQPVITKSTAEEVSTKEAEESEEESEEEEA